MEKKKEGLAILQDISTRLSHVQGIQVVLADQGGGGSSWEHGIRKAGIPKVTFSVKKSYFLVTF